jgi:4-carboxymuconolactone decarboxylase
MKHLKTLAALVAAILLPVGPPPAQARDAFDVNEVSQVAPSFVHYSHDVVRKLWERPELSPRDRSLVTLAALISRAPTIELPYYVGQALDNGVKPGEISEIITHLSFYASRASALSAAVVVRQVFVERKVGADQLPAAEPKLLALDELTEAKRAQLVSQSFGVTAPGLVQYTTDVLFRQVWLRPDLAPRDRSLVTVSALVASGHVAQLPFHLNKAMDGGLTQTQAGEIITHLAFYVGWPSAFSALPVAKEVFEKRSKP